MSGRSITNEFVAAVEYRRLNAGCPAGVSVTRKRAPDRDPAQARNRPRTLFGVADEEIYTSDDPNALLGQMRALSVAVPGVEPGTFGL